MLAEATCPAIAVHLCSVYLPLGGVQIAQTFSIVWLLLIRCRIHAYLTLYQHQSVIDAAWLQDTGL